MKPFILEEIKSGETFEHEGPVEVSGSIGENAILKITGPLIIRGDVGNGVKISNNTGPKADKNSFESNKYSIGNDLRDRDGDKVKGDKYVFNGGTFGSIGRNTKGSMGSSSKVIIDQKEASHPSIQILGNLGNNVVVDSIGNLEIQDAGDRLSVRSGGSIKARNIGHSSYLDAKMALEADGIGNKAEIYTKMDAKVNHYIGKDSFIKSKMNIYAALVDEGSTLKANMFAKINQAHATAFITGKIGTDIQKRFGGDPSDPVNNKKSRFNF